MEKFYSCIRFVQFAFAGASFQNARANLLPKAQTLRGLFGTFLVCLACMLSVGCSDDSQHADLPPAPPLKLHCQGVLTTSIPAMPMFTPVQSPDYVKLAWTDASRSVAAIEVGAFDIEVSMMGRTLSIGTISVADVACSAQPDGSITLTKDNFTCQAGNYEVKGKLMGVYREGQLTLTLTYRPGSMPFDCQSDFVSQSIS